jgi:deazaflavin-dependent oxidoreductase (nitroreductase family)
MDFSHSTSGMRMRRTFKVFNRFMILMWRLGLGVWLKSKETWGQVLVIVHQGRKSGLKRYAPVNYALVDGELYCTAAFGLRADWYRNLMANPEIEIWHPDGRWEGVAEDVSDSGHRVALMREVLIGSGFAARVFGLNPHALSDEELTKVTQSYRLLHLRRGSALTGPGGPGDLAWIWPLATFGLLWILLRRRRKR